MKTQRIFTKTDMAFFLIILFVLFASLGAVGRSGRHRAKEALCLANLQQWGAVFQAMALENDGRIFTPNLGIGYEWLYELDADWSDWKKNRAWFCPEADEPGRDEFGNTREGGPYTAWGIHYPSQGGELGISGSYGLNGYVAPLQGRAFGTFLSGVSSADGWPNAYVPGAARAPLLIDAMRRGLYPRETEAAPAEPELAPWSADSMARCALNRHNGAVNCLFLDFSARKVGLKELWTLKWHRSFNTAGPWTLAGGVQPEDWPEWMRGFKDY